jgi:hypothetical protein
MVKNVKIQKLIAISLNNNFRPVDMCYKLGIGTTTWNRWIRGIAEPKNKNIIDVIDKFISEYQGKDNS